MSTVEKEMVSWYYSENTFDLTDLPKESWGCPGSHRLQFENYCSKTWMGKVLHEKQHQIKTGETSPEDSRLAAVLEKDTTRKRT